jgi:uncharacterized protein with LGFP repeats
VPFRRPAPTILLTAVVATVMILPWATDPRLGHEPPSAAATQLTQQPLPALGAGVTVREIARDQPFSMVALTGADLTGTSARVRAKRADGSWGPWYDTEYEAGALKSHSNAGDNADSDENGDHGSGRSSSGLDGTDPVFVGNTTTVQIAVTRPAGAPATSPPNSGAPAKRRLGYVPATAEHPLPQNISAVLIAPPRAPVDTQMAPPAAVTAPGQPPSVIPRSEWGAPESNRCGGIDGDSRVRAAVVHHTAGSNDYAPENSAGIVRSIYAYHTRTLGWCDIGYNALVDQYGQVFEGRAGGITSPVRGTHAGGFNRYTWSVSMIGNFEDETPPPIQLRTVGRLVGWRLSLDNIDPHGTTKLSSAGGSYTFYARGATVNLPNIFSHRDVGITACPGDAGYAALDEIRDIAAGFKGPLSARDLARALEGSAIHMRWAQLGGMAGMMGAPTSMEAAAAGSARYVIFNHGAIYWSPEAGAQPVTGAIYEAWASLGYERGVLGLPTSGEIQEPEWVQQNFQHGTLNFDRASGTVTRVVDGIADLVPSAPPDGPPVQLERFSRAVDPSE